MPQLLSHSSRPVRWTVAALAAVAASAGALLAATAPAAAATPACQTGGLVIWLDTNGNGTAGSVFYNLHFTNLSGHRCTLRGFPGVSAIGLRGGRLGNPGTRNHQRRVRTVSIRNGGTATSVLRVVDNGAIGNCRMVTAAGLRVFPPNGRRSKTIPFPFGACRNTSVMTVEAVRSGFLLGP
jgi:hypothetical protein